MNIRGQTGLNVEKQLQIEHFIQQNSIDILHCQEIDISEDTFEECNYINSTFDIISINSPNMYGTASLVKNELSTPSSNSSSKFQTEAGVRH